METEIKMDFGKELDRLKQESKTYPDNLKLQAGETKIKFLSDVIREYATEEGTKKIFEVEVDGKRWSWWLNVKNPIYGLIIKAGKGRGTLANYEIVVIKTGELKKTRYEIKG